MNIWTRIGVALLSFYGVRSNVASKAKPTDLEINEITTFSNLVVSNPAGLEISPVSEIEKKDNHPNIAIRSRSAKKLTSLVRVHPESGKEIIGKYSVEELMIPQDRIYVITPDGRDDMVFHLAGFGSLTDFITSKKERYGRSQFSLIKRAQLEEVVSRNDFNEFKRIISIAMDELKSNFDDASMLPSFPVLRNRMNKGATQDDAIDFIAKTTLDVMGLSKKISKPLIKKVLDNFPFHPATWGNEKLHADLKESLREAIFSRFEKEEYVAKIFQNFKDSVRIGEASNSRQETIEFFNKIQETAIRRTDYNDRIEKTWMFVNDDNAQVIVSHPAVSNTVSPGVLGNMVANQRNILSYFPHDYGNPAYIPIVSDAYTHEMLHNADKEFCTIDSDGRVAKMWPIVNDGARPEEYMAAFPCGNNEKVDYKTGTILLNALKQDMKMSEFMISNQENIRVKQMSGLITTHTTARTTAEIIPTATDLFKAQELLYCMPNVAVVRTRMIINESPEAKLYTAILTCDMASVRKMITEDSSILDKEYDRIPLHQLSQIIVDAKFDEIVDHSLKKGGKKNDCTYKMLNNLINDQYKRHQATASNGFSKGNEL